jgi:FtsH-binding integral membrane protein
MNVSSAVNAVEYEQGLRSYLLSIYNWMILGLLVSAGAAFFAHASGLTETLKQGGALFWIVALAPFGVIFFMARAMSGASSVSAMAVSFLLLAGCEGLTVSVLLERFTGTSVVTAFLITASAFAALSLWGYTTKRNLTGMGSFFLIALVGLIVAMLVGVLTASPLFNTLVSIGAVVIFGGLVAYDTQLMRSNYHPGNADSNARHAIWHALDLYLDFVNLMIHILKLTGTVKSDD